MTSRMQILDTEFCLQGDQDLFSFCRRMGESYGADRALPPAARRVTVTVAEGGRPTPRGAPTFFHASANYEHWNIRGEHIDGGIALPQYGVSFRILDGAGLSVDIEGRHPRQPELVFHAARNMSLYMRDRRSSVLLHASGACVGDALVLVGGAKGSGKSTVFAEMVTNLAAVPFSNDRCALVEGGEGVKALSWPSYLSYCEGTILDYPWLRRAFLAYEDEARPAGLKSWGSDFERRYDQAGKRIVPPFHLDAAQFPYRAVAEPRLLMLPRADLAISGARLLDVRTSAQLSGPELGGLVFGDDDDDIRRWHALPAAPAGSGSGASILLSADIPVARVAFNPATGKPDLLRIIDSLLSQNA